MVVLCNVTSVANKLRIHGSEVHMSIGVQTDPRKRLTYVILETVLGLS